MVLAPNYYDAAAGTCGRLRAEERREAQGRGQPAQVAREREQGLARRAEGQELRRLGMCAGTTSSSREKREKTLGRAGWETRSRSRRPASRGPGSEPGADPPGPQALELKLRENGH